MNPETIPGFISEFYGISAEDISVIIGYTTCRNLIKGEVLLADGEICRSLYFIEKGYLRSYSYKDDNVINLNFSFEGEFTSNLKSLKSRKPSELSIAAGEDSIVWIFDLDKLPEMVKKQPSVNVFIRRLAVRILLASEEHSHLFKMYSATERYHYIEKNNPELLQRVPLSQLASYLGVSRETLSRIRAKAIHTNGL